MSTKRWYRARVISILICSILVPGIADAQELEWYRTDRTMNLVAAHGVEGGVLVSGFVHPGASGGPSTQYLQLLAEDGTEKWKVEIPGGNSYYAATSPKPLVGSHPDGGWWFVHRWMETGSSTGTFRYFFIRHSITPNGDVTSSDTIEGKPTVVFEDGTLIAPPMNFFHDQIAWTRYNVDAGRIDSVAVDLGSAMSYFQESPTIAWSHTVRANASVLLTDALLGKCLLVTINLRSGSVQTTRLDDIPTTGLDGVITRDGSVVILGRENQWADRSRNNLVLIRPQIEGNEPERIRLPVAAPPAPRIEGELSTGELIIATETEPNMHMERLLYRVSSDGFRVSSLRLYTVYRWTMSITPDDAMYVQWISSVGKVLGSGVTSSVSGEPPPVDPWTELDLSGVE